MRAILLSLILAFISTTAFAAPPEGFTASLEVVGGNEVIAGDPMVVTLRVRNESTQRVSFVVPIVDPPSNVNVGFDLLPPGDAREWVALQHGIGAEFDPMSGGEGPHEVVTLEPGESTHFNVPFSGWHHNRYGATPPRIGYHLGEPGEYRLRARLLVLGTPTTLRTTPDGTLVEWFTTSPVAFRIILPESDEDRAALADLLKTPELVRLYAPWRTGAKINQEVLRLREQHARSRYAKFTEMEVLYSRLRRVGNRDKQVARSIHAESVELVHRARRDGWPPGWIAIAEELERQIRPFAYRANETPATLPASQEAIQGR